MEEALWSSNIPSLPAPRRGKVRDLYDLGDQLLLIACDRLSAFDHVLHPGIPGKGRILNQLTNHWFTQTRDIVANHLLSTDPMNDLPGASDFASQLDGRSVLVHKAVMIPFECVARGYLAGSAYKEYLSSGMACGYSLPAGLERASRLSEPLFTPASKAESGHDENITFQQLIDSVGAELAGRLRDVTLALYEHGARQAAAKGLILADTKFEFGFVDGELTLVDEALTPDSSRYWETSSWRTGAEPASFDKQFVRNWLDAQGWDHESTPPTLPREVVLGTRNRYLEAFRRITGHEPDLGSGK